MGTKVGEQGFVYVIRFGEYVKIGFSVSPGDRLKQLRTRNSGTLQPRERGEAEPVTAFPGTRETEHALHIAFHNDRAIGEYYHCRGMVKEWVDRLVLENNVGGFQPPPEVEPPTRYIFVHCGNKHVEDLEVDPSEVVTHPAEQVSHEYEFRGPVDF